MGFSYKKSYESLLKLAQEHNLKVVIVPRSILKDYTGMNSKTAERLGFKMPPDTIYLSKSLKPEDRFKVLRTQMKEYFEI